MYKYIDNYVNTNHVTQFPYPLHPPPSPYPSPTYSSDLVGAFICKAQNYCRKCYIYTVGYLSNWYCDPGLRDRNLTRIRNTKTDVTKYKFIAVKPNQSNC